jgi:hypothetical protein
MISLYRMFQMIFGIVVSVFILYFLIQYASNYAGFQEDVQKVTIIKNLKITAESVYTYGNPVVFPDTSMRDFSSCYMTINKPEPPIIKCNFGEIGSVLIPLLLSADGEVVVDRADLNFGWHVMHWVEVMPESVILFTPMDSSDETWNLMKNLTEVLPSTENLDAKITFDFCDGNYLTGACGGPCEKFDFMSVLDSHQAQAAKCTRSLSKEHKLITISSQCRAGFSDYGVCVKLPQNGVGLAYLADSGETYVYKDPMDIIALLIGGSEKDVLGKTFGEKLYDYKNEVWGERLSLAAKIMKQRMLLVSSRYQYLGENLECIPIYANLAGVLASITDTAKGDYKNEVVMRNLVTRLREAESLYQNLIDLGCEYYV